MSLGLQTKAFLDFLPFHGKALCSVFVGNSGRGKFLTSPPTVEDLCFISVQDPGPE